MTPEERIRMLLPCEMLSEILRHISDIKIVYGLMRSNACLNEMIQTCERFWKFRLFANKINNIETIKTKRPFATDCLWLFQKENERFVPCSDPRQLNYYLFQTNDFFDSDHVYVAYQSRHSCWSIDHAKNTTIITKRHRQYGESLMKKRKTRQTNDFFLVKSHRQYHDLISRGYCLHRIPRYLLERENVLSEGARKFVKYQHTKTVDGNTSHLRSLSRFQCASSLNQSNIFCSVDNCIFAK